MQTFAVIDSALRILWVGGDWDEFAQANQGNAALAKEVLSTRIDAHIVGDQTREAVSALLTAVQESQNELKITYRCDSHTFIRRFQLTVKPMKEERLLMVHDLRDLQGFAQRHSHWHYRHDAEASKCSFCNAIKLQRQAWTPPEALEDHPFAVNFVICPECERNVDEAIATARGQRKPRRRVVNGYGPEG